MNEKSFRSSSRQEKRITTSIENEIFEPQLMKKLQISYPIETKEGAKIPITNGKGNLKLKQEYITQEIEKENIQAFMEEQMAKFDPPYCNNCPKRRADRVCINKKCGRQYMELICGKCHFDAHKDAQAKPEIDIQEYFTKLQKFISLQQYEKNNQSQAIIKTEILEPVLTEIKNIKEKLGNLKCQLANEVEGYQSPSEMQTIIQNGMTQALTKFEVKNIEHQLGIIKNSILFLNNNFFWDDGSQKYETFSKQIKEFEKLSEKMNSIIYQSLIPESQINLSELKCLPSSSLNSVFAGFIEKSYQTKSKDDQIILTNCPGAQIQVYLDYKLDTTKKYKFRFRFGLDPIEYVMVGVMPQSMVQNQWVYNIPGHYFSKRFFNIDPNYECSRIIRGMSLCARVQKDMQIQMRIDFASNYVDFADYPDFKNVNASLHNNQFRFQEDYVLAFTFNQQNQIILESLEEVNSIDQY